MSKIFISALAALFISASISLHADITHTEKQCHKIAYVKEGGFAY
jgi:hypothetical protein